MVADPIISDLQFVMETSQELDILNFHKSFPITCKASVETIQRGAVVMKVQPPGSVVLEQQDSTIVLSRGLPEAVRARIESFDLVSGLLRLSDFEYVGSHFGERMIARVQPEDPIDVELDLEGQKYHGTLVDVSLSGVGVSVTETIFQRGQMIQLTLPLPEGAVSLPGKILNISENPGGSQRLSIGFTRNAQEIAVVMRYVKDRRTEILNEIEHMYERSFHEKQSQSKPSQSNPTAE